MGAKRKSYPPKYRQDAAQLVIDTGRTICAVAKEIGVGEALLGRWVAIERSRLQDPPDALDINERAELTRQRQESTELRPDRTFLKKAAAFSVAENANRQAFELIEAEKATMGVTRMTDLLGVSRSRHHAWEQRQVAGPGPRACRRADLVIKIRVAHGASDGVNGAPRITADLRDAGEVVAGKTVAKLLRQNEIRGISPRPWRPVTTISVPNPNAIADLVKRCFDQGVLNVVWTSDITYLAAVRDGCPTRVLGYAFSDSLHTDVVKDALRRTVSFRAPSDTFATAGRAQLPEQEKVIFHADRGCQYTSAQLAVAAAEDGVRLSVGRTRVCFDNAQQESFWSSLKTEYFNRHTFATRADAIHAVSAWIENGYNRRRRHSSLGMISPVAFEHRIFTTATREAA